MPRPTKSNIRQRPRNTKEPAYALFDDVDDQPRLSSLSSLSAAERLKKTDIARRDFVARQVSASSAIFKRKIRGVKRSGDNDQVLTDVLMDFEEGDQGRTEYEESGGDWDWEDEEATAEEVLIYIRTKGGIEDYELKGHRVRSSKGVVDQSRWEEEMPELVEGYLDYCYHRHLGKTHNDSVRVMHRMLVWSITGYYELELPVYSSDRWTNTSYIRSGYLPFNTLLNNSLVSLDTIIFYHHLFMRCPRLGIQPFVRALMDMQGRRYRNNLSVQFSSAYDLYLQLVSHARAQVQKALHRDTPNWRVNNACPSCQYEVKNEKVLPISMFIAIDGNNSLKRMERREQSEDGSYAGPVKERLDNRVGGGDYFLSPQEVDLWDEKQWYKWPGWAPRAAGPKVPCEDRWSNLKESKTCRSFGSFDVNGIFAGFCRHSFVIALLDMVKTGEQSKYMLALLHYFMSACSEERRRLGLPPLQGSLAVGYDIACGMIDKISRSPLQDLANDHKLRMLIGLLHAYGHNRLCQLSFLMLYINGTGIEDLETCERFFSHSNALAPVTRYMSKFHRRQAIANYAYHRDNFEAYANLSNFIYGNYKQTLSILNRSKDTAKTLRDVGLLGDTQKAIDWLEEERLYLESRKSTPEGETLKSGYYLALVKLNDTQDRLHRSRLNFRRWTSGEAGKNEGHDPSLFLTERHMANAQELEAKLLVDVQSYEERLGMGKNQRWQAGSEEWRNAEDRAEMAKYQKALDKLEGLIVARIFELSKMNVAGTGYKMRQHIGQALRKRSKAIQAALSDYNSAAAALKPPRKLLDWTDVMNYTYLSEFNFLRDTRADIREKEWSKPAVREAMSELFRLARAQEELDRLHLEIQRLYTYMAEEQAYFKEQEKRMQLTNPALAFQIRQHGWERQRFNEAHRKKLWAITKLRGFSPIHINFFRKGVGVRRQGVAVEDVEEDANEELEMEGNDESEEEDGEDNADHLTEVILGIAIDDP